MKGVCITDLTLSELSYASNKAALGFCKALYHMGVSFVEMMPSVYRRIEGVFPPEHVSLKIGRMEEYLYYRGHGIHRFSVKVDDFKAMAEDTEHKSDKDVFTVIFPSDGSNFSGADFNVMPDTAEKLRICGCDRVMQEDYTSFFSNLNEKFGEMLEFDPHDKCYMATAAALEYIFNGGRNICTSFCGIFSHAATEQLMAALNLTAGTDFDLTKLPELRACFESFWNRTLPCHLPLAGRDIFAYESGIHADGINKNPANYEPFDPKLVGAERKLVIGKHSGRSAIRRKLFEFGYMPSEPAVVRLNSEVRKFSEKNGKSLSDSEFLNLYLSLSDGIEN